MNEIERAAQLDRLRLDFDTTLAKLQRLLLDIHKAGGFDVIAYREDGEESEIYRMRRDAR